MKIDTAIQQANIILKKNYIKSSLLDSEILISKVINKTREYIILNLHKEINRRRERKQHALNTIYLMGVFIFDFIINF